MRAPVTIAGEYRAPRLRHPDRPGQLDIEQSELEIQQRRLELDEQERLELVSEIEEMHEILAARKEKPWAG